MFARKHPLKLSGTESCIVLLKKNYFGEFTVFFSMDCDSKLVKYSTVVVVPFNKKKKSNELLWRPKILWPSYCHRALKCVGIG